jgi:choline dehydrogenase-like flavoprotein
MPRIVAGNTNATIVMSAEKCSAMVLEDALRSTFAATELASA